MVSKKLWIVTIVCLGLLLTAIGVYSYVTISNLNNQVDTLQDTVSLLEEERDQLQDEISQMKNTANFVFEWTSANKGEWVLPAAPRAIVVTLNKTLRMELNFTMKNENLSIIVKVNDDSLCLHCTSEYLGIVLDENGDGNLDSAYPLFAGNTTYSSHWISWGKEGNLGPFPLMAPIPSPYHTCVIEQDMTTFNVTLPLPLSDLVHVCYSFDIGWVYVRFHIGLLIGAD